MKTRKIMGYTYILLIHLFLALVLWKPDFIGRIGTKYGFQSANLKYFHTKMTTYHRAMDASIPEEAVLFIGDSITQALATSAISPSSVNFGIGSDTTLGVIKRIPHHESIERAKAVVLSIGINDIHQRMDRADTLTNYKSILDHIPSGVTVVASSILPIGSDAETRRFNNEAITSLNKDIEKLAKKYKNVTYINADMMLKDGAGFLLPAFHVGDGVHLSDQGYAVVIEQLKETLLGIDEQ